MGQPDIVTKKYMQSKEKFADAFNYFLYGGEQRIKPEQLHELDSTVVEVPYGEDDAGFVMQPIQRTRDVYRSVTSMTDGSAVYLLLGIENQNEIHYAMAVKDGLYDMLEYAGQVQVAAKSHRHAENKKGGAEFLSGFYKRDRLIPVITLVIYWGAEEWDAPRTLHEMFETKDEVILSYVSDYKINLICPSELPEEEFKKFKTHLGPLLELVKVSHSKDRFNELVNSQPVYNYMDNDDAIVIKGLLQIDIGVDNGKEAKSVCQAVERMRTEAADIASRTEKVNMAERLLRRGKMTIKEIAEDTGLTVEEIEEIDRRRPA